MYIKRIFARKFGKLDNVNLEFTRGLNVIYGANEAGKSSIQAFIKAMFYGLPDNRKKGVSQNDRMKYLPWDGGNCAGSMELKCNGQGVIVERTFGKTVKSDSLSVSDSVTGMEKSDIISLGVGETFFNMSEASFEKTLWIRQGNVYNVGADDGITRKLINLAQSGDDDISYGNASETLSGAMKELRAQRGNGGRINGLIAQKAEFTEYYNKIKQNSRNVSEYIEKLGILDDEKIALEKQIKEDEENIKIARDHEKIKEFKKLEEYANVIKSIEDNEEIKPFSDIDINVNIEVETKKRRLEELKSYTNYARECENTQSRLKEEKSKKKSYFITYIILLFLASISAYFLLNIIPPYLPIAALLLVLGLGVFTIKKKSDLISILRAELIKYQTAQNEAQQQISEIEEFLNGIYRRTGSIDFNDYTKKYSEAAFSRVNAEAHRNAFYTMLGNRDFQKLKEESENLRYIPEKNYINIIDTENSLREAQKRMLEVIREIKNLENEIGKQSENEISLSDIVSKIENLNEEIEKNEETYTALQIASDTLNKVFAHMQKDFGPKLNKSVQSVLKIATDGKYTDIKVSEDFTVKIQTGGGEYKDSGYFSAGAFDQFYFSLRMGIIELVCGENAVVFLDDAFTNYDINRLKGVLGYLYEFSKSRQTIVFTCHESVADNIRMNKNVNIIEI